MTRPSISLATVNLHQSARHSHFLQHRERCCAFVVAQGHRPYPTVGELRIVHGVAYRDPTGKPG